MCRGLVSCADLKAILTPFSEVIWNRYSSFSKNGKADLSVHRWPDVTPQIAFSSTGKVPNCNKNNSSIKPNKFRSKYVCFVKTREERKICLKIHLFGFPETLVMRHATTAARNVVSFSTLIGTFEFEREHEWPLNVSARSNSNGPIGAENETTLRAAGVACLITRISGKPKRWILRQIFRSSRVFRPLKHTYLEWNLLVLKLLFLLQFGTFPVEEKAICGVTSGQRCAVWSTFPFF